MAVVTNRSLSHQPRLPSSHISYIMRTRSTVLGKRGHQDSPNSLCEQLQTPDNTPNPKRARTATVVVDGDSNKENVPPFNISPLHIAATPTLNLMELTLSTPPPSPPTSLLPIQARVRALLRSTCNNTSSSIAGRDVERASLLGFLSSFIDGTSIDHDTHTTSMFISGAPGTGKTALVNAIIRDLLAKNDHVKVISINCMALKSVDALWERIIEDLATTPRRKPIKNKKTNSHDRLKTLLSTLNTQWYVFNIIFNDLTQSRAPSVSLF
jgi:cell division control protein 6